MTLWTTQVPVPSVRPICRARTRVSAKHLDRFSEHFAAEIVDRHLRGLARQLSRQVGKAARVVGEHADLDDIAGDLRLRRSAGEQQSGNN